MTIVLYTNRPVVLPVIDFFFSIELLKIILSANLFYSENPPSKNIFRQLHFVFYKTTQNKPKAVHQFFSQIAYYLSTAAPPLFSDI